MICEVNDCNAKATHVAIDIPMTECGNSKNIKKNVALCELHCGYMLDVLEEMSGDGFVAPNNTVIILEES